MDLRSTQNEPGVESDIGFDFQASDFHNDDESYSFNFEHGQWWVTELGTGRQWSVVDAVIRGEECFDFEEVSSGEER